MISRCRERITIGCLESNFNLKGNRGKKELFEGYVLVDFEGYKLKAPSGYHEILTSIYSDYMTTPKNAQTHHTNECYYIKK